jgi:CBS domain-containing protein
MEFTETIKQHMRRDIISLTQDERLSDVISKMSTAAADIAVVKSSTGDIAGVITESDIYFTLVKEVFPERTGGYLKHSRNVNDMTVSDLLKGPLAEKMMSLCQNTGPRPCVDACEDDSLEDAIRILQMSGLHHLLVFDKNNRLVGTLSSHEIIKSLTLLEEKKV